MKQCTRHNNSRTRLISIFWWRSISTTTVLCRPPLIKLESAPPICQIKPSFFFFFQRTDKRQSKRNSKTGAWQSHGIMPEATTEIPSWKEWRLNGLSDYIFASWNSDKAVWLYFLLWHVKQLPMNIWKYRVWLKPLSAHFLSGQDAGNVWSLHPVEVSSVWPLNVLRFFLKCCL